MAVVLMHLLFLLILPFLVSWVKEFAGILQDNSYMKGRELVATITSSTRETYQTIGSWLRNRSATMTTSIKDEARRAKRRTHPAEMIDCSILIALLTTKQPLYFVFYFREYIVHS
jgi:hypothetical protein